MAKGRENVGHFELMVLLAVMRLKDDAYGLPILTEIEQRVGREVALGSVYAALNRLESKGFVSSRLGEPTAARGGKAKRYFKATASGIREVHGIRRALVSLWQGIPDAHGGVA
ncbi:MAG TPA: PadR family transcriptional regulator [Vicinamibacterales bacterium]|nr:PadR family transcriptional regulator [Vicinamibacterales bacterium]